MAQEDLIRTPYGFGGIGPIDQWFKHDWDPAVYTDKNYRNIVVTNGGDLNERETGNLYVSLRNDDVTETCTPVCGQVISLGPGDTHTFPATINIRMWLRWTSPDIAILVQEFYPS